MNELSVIIDQKVGTIDFNFYDLKKSVEQIADAYKGIDVTEDTVISSRADVATLRKIITAIEDKRKSVKKECLKPYDDFERKAKDLISVIEVPVKDIDIQIKTFEEAKRQRKKEEIVIAFNDLIGGMIEYLSLEKIYDPKWENVNVSMKSIREAITSKIENVSIAVETIKSMNSGYIENALKQFKNDLNLSNAIASINRYEQQRKEILEREERCKEEEARKSIEREEILKREKEIELVQQELFLKRDAEQFYEEVKPVGFDDPFSVNDKPFVKSIPIYTYEVKIPAYSDGELKKLLNEISATYRRI